MLCPQCEATDNRVVDTRTSRGGRAVRRRRECAVCNTRFTTYEYVEERSIKVLKSGGNAEDFDREKLARSVFTACAKRPVSASEIEDVVDQIEDVVSSKAGLEVPSAHIGELVMDHLRRLDRVAYVRFASVYKDFQDIDEFQEEVEDLNTRQRHEEAARDQAELKF
jgi:transcriptional repressor NrdR